MFHLFDKVYLNFDHNLSAYESRVVISEQFARDLTHETTPAPQHAQGTTISHVIGNDKQFATELNFFKEIKTIANNNRLMIYCDKVAFVHLFIAWHKILLNVTSSETVWNIWKMFVNKESYRSTITQQDGYAFFTSINIDTWNRTDFENQFSAINVTKDLEWNSSVLESLGIEYLLSTHLISSSTDVRTALKNKIKLLASRVMQGEIYDTKLNVVANAFNHALHSALSISQPSTIEDLLSTPSLQIFKDPLIWSADGKMVASATNTALKINELTSDQTTQMINAFKLVRQDFQKCNEDSPLIKKIEWLSWINEDITDEQLTNILNSNIFSACELVDDSDSDKVNMLLVDRLLSLHRTTGVSSLSELTISL